MDASQLRMARAGLNINVHQLALRAGVDADTISNIANDKNTKTQNRRREASIQKLRDYLDSQVVFVDPKPGEHGPGVILREGADVSPSHGRRKNGSNGADEVSASWEQPWSDLPQSQEIVVNVQFLGGAARNAR